MAGQGTRGYTLQEINAMDNGQGGMVIATRGGYGCRHRWVPIADSIDETQDTRDMLTVESELRNKGVIFGSDQRPAIWIQNKDGKIVNKMNRAVKEDDKGYYYKRFDGKRQGIEKRDGNFIFEASI
jgi:hypothetical protein